MLTKVLALPAADGLQRRRQLPAPSEPPWSCFAIQGLKGKPSVADASAIYNRIGALLAAERPRLPAPPF
ncbi:MAG TPA: hypothetical protein VI122_06180 [Thermoleophilaceae bacterium]